MVASPTTRAQAWSAPELLVNEIIDAFRAHYEVSVEQVTLREENVSFKLPRELREVPATP